jgi:hypothetical protein
MSNRFHSKFHRSNHHTYANDQNPDTGHDPIASPNQPFNGDFILAGALSAVAPLSSYAGYFFSNNTSIVGYSPNIGLSATGGQIAGVFSSPTVALSTYSLYPNDPIPNSATPYIGPAFVSKNVLNNRTGIFTENPISAFHVTGGTYLDGHCTITGNLSVAGDLTRLDTFVYITSSTEIVVSNNSNTTPALYVSNSGENNIFEAIDSDTGNIGMIISGYTSAAGYVGINTSTPNTNLTVNGNISANGTFYTVNEVISSNLVNSNFNFSPLIVAGNASGSLYESIQNFSQSNSASTDISIYNDTGLNYLDFGINGSNYDGNAYYPTFNIVGPNDSYLYTTSGNLAIGSTKSSSGDLIFFTAGSLSGTNPGNERLRITNSGKIGISNSVPTNTLDVSGSFRVGGINKNGDGYFGFNGNTDVTLGCLSRGSAASNRALVADISNTLTINYNGDFSGGVLFGSSPTNNESTSIIFTSSGNVGIGTKTPNAKLTINGDISSNGNLSTTILSSYELKLQHTSSNDGINPKLFIGEVGDGYNTTILGSLSGFNIGYNEIQNKFNITTQFGNSPSLTALIVDQNANIIANTSLTVPSITATNNLTVSGSISSSGALYVPSIPNTYGVTNLYTTNLLNISNSTTSLTTPAASALSLYIPTYGLYLIDVFYVGTATSTVTFCGATTNLVASFNASNVSMTALYNYNAGNAKGTNVISVANATVNLNSNYLQSTPTSAGQTSTDLISHIYTGTVNVISPGYLTLRTAVATASGTNPMLTNGQGSYIRATLLKNGI